MSMDEDPDVMRDLLNIPEDPSPRRYRDMPAELRHACATCGATGGTHRFFLCECCGLEKRCLTCCLLDHATKPLHIVAEWNGRSRGWHKKPLVRLGFVYQLGHGGAPCPSPSRPRSLLVVAADGCHDIDFSFCNCGPPTHGDSIMQFLQVEWFPATSYNITTCVTFRSLDMAIERLDPTLIAYLPLTPEFHELASVSFQYGERWPWADMMVSVLLSEGGCYLLAVDEDDDVIPDLISLDQTDDDGLDFERAGSGRCLCGGAGRREGLGRASASEVQASQAPEKAAKKEADAVAGIQIRLPEHWPKVYRGLRAKL
ncbi:hypothetical protein DFH06DRAFT_1148723 [Mycena polygramma]|nr:hypothetical protein DFH06DRAFT_1148723 [Mycena polygramma]